VLLMGRPCSGFVRQRGAISKLKEGKHLSGYPQPLMVQCIQCSMSNTGFNECSLMS